MISGEGWMVSGQETVLFASSSLDNHGGLARLLFFSTYLLTTHKQVVTR
jgi:hypothetical protein